MSVWWVVIPLLLGHGSHKSESVWRVRTDAGLVAGSLVFEARDLRTYGRGADGFTPEQAAERIDVRADGARCQLETIRVQPVSGRHRLAGGWRCASGAETYTIDLLGITRLDATHVHQARLDDGHRVQAHQLTPKSTVMRANPSAVAESPPVPTAPREREGPSESAPEHTAPWWWAVAGLAGVIGIAAGWRVWTRCRP